MRWPRLACCSLRLNIAGRTQFGWRVEENRNTPKLSLHTKICFWYFSSVLLCNDLVCCQQCHCMFSPFQMADIWLAHVQSLAHSVSVCVWDHSHTKMEIWFPITTLLLDGITPVHTHILDGTSVPPPVPSWLFVTEGQSPVLCGERLRLRKRLVSEPGAAAKHDLVLLFLP